MAYDVRILPDADREFQEYALWYESRDEGLGLSLISLIEDTLDKNSKSPKRFPVKKDSFREAIGPVLLIVVVFKIYESGKIVTINSIIYTKRDEIKRFKQ